MVVRSCCDKAPLISALNLRPQLRIEIRIAGSSEQKYLRVAYDGPGPWQHAGAGQPESFLGLCDRDKPLCAANAAACPYPGVDLPIFFMPRQLERKNAMLS